MNKVIKIDIFIQKISILDKIVIKTSWFDKRMQQKSISNCIFIS